MRRHAAHRGDGAPPYGRVRLCVCLIVFVFIFLRPESTYYRCARVLNRRSLACSMYIPLCLAADSRLHACRTYEHFGLASPIAILGLIAFQRRSGNPMNSVWLAQVGIVAGITALIVALFFARATSPINPVARLQPLRIFQIVYALMILAIGATLGELVLKRSVSRWVAIFLLLGATMFCVQRQTFPNSAHLEFPWRTQTNEWQQAFLWIKANTP